MTNLTDSIDRRSQSGALDGFPRDAHPAVGTRGGQEVDNSLRDALDPAIGIGNALICGGALWAVAFLLFSLVA